MKETLRNLILPFTVIAALGVFQACSSENGSALATDQDMPEIVKAELDDELIVEEILDEVLYDIEQFDFKKSESTCPVITVETEEGTRYPKVVTKDFGEGCITDWGAEKSGKVIITVYGPWLRNGSKRIVEFEDYTHRGRQVDGEKVITCVGKNDKGLFVHTILGNLEITRPDSTVIERKLRKKRTMLAGFNQPDVPKEWLLEGSVKVKKSDGTRYIMKVQEPLYRIQGCRWPQAGVKAIYFNPIDADEDDANTEKDFSHKVTIDYSAVGPVQKDCDSYVLRSIDDQEPFEVDLRDKN